MKVISVYIRVGIVVMALVLTFRGQGQENTVLNDQLILSRIKSDSNIKSIKGESVRGDVFSIEPNGEVLIYPSQKESALSFRCWIRPRNIEEHQGTIIGKENIFYFRYLPTRELQFNHYRLSDTKTKAILCEDQWQQVGFTLAQSGELCLYFNGELVAHDTLTTRWFESDANYIIGRDLYQISGEGYLDDIHLDRRVLSADEMKREYEQSVLSTSLNTGLIAYFPFQDDMYDVICPDRPVECFGNVALRKRKNNRGLFFEEEYAYLKISHVTFDKQQTLSLFMKPNSLYSPLALLGSSDFVLRYLYRESQLWYSVPMQFGLKSKPFEVINTEWIHVAVVVSFNHKIQFYVNGELIDEQPIGDKNGKTKELFIGRSIWNDTYLGGIRDIAIWNRALTLEEVKEVYHGKLTISKEQHHKSYVVIFVAFILILLVFVSIRYSILNRRKKKLFQNRSPISLPQRNSIQFLNTFKAINSYGEDVTSTFTPTLQRLFVTLVVYQLLHSRSISSLLLSECLWNELDTNQQKNNRNANMHKLRLVLNQFDGIFIKFVCKEWVVTIQEAIFIDIVRMEKGIDDPFTLQGIAFDKKLYQSGTRALLLQYDDKRLIQLAHRADCLVKEKDYLSLQLISRWWLSLDPLSDEALNYYVVSCLKLGQRKQAVDQYNQFIQQYEELLGESYPHSFGELG